MPTHEAGGFTGGILEETTSAGGFSKLCAADRHPPLGTYLLQEKAECQTLQKKAECQNLWEKAKCHFILKGLLPGISRSKKRVPNLLSLSPPGPPPWARPLQPARAWQVLRRLPDDNPWEEDEPQLLGLCLTLGSRNGHHNQNRSKLLGLLLAGFSPRPSNLGCSLGTGSKQDRHTLLSPLMSRNSLCKRIAGAETECPSLLDLHPDAKQDRQLATKKAECQSLLDLHQDVKQDGRLLDTKKAECRSLLDRRRQSSLAKKTASASTPAAEFRQTLQEYAKKNVEVPKVIPKIPPDRLVARNLVGKGGKGKLPAFPGLSGKAKAMAQKGQGLDPHLVGKS